MGIVACRLRSERSELHFHSRLNEVKLTRTLGKQCERFETKFESKNPERSIRVREKPCGDLIELTLGSASQPSRSISNCRVDQLYLDFPSDPPNRYAIRETTRQSPVQDMFGVVWFRFRLRCVRKRETNSVAGKRCFLGSSFQGIQAKLNVRIRSRRSKRATVMGWWLDATIFHQGLQP